MMNAKFTILLEETLRALGVAGELKKIADAIIEALKKNEYAVIEIKNFDVCPMEDFNICPMGDLDLH